MARTHKAEMLELADKNKAQAEEIARLNEALTKANESTVTFEQKAETLLREQRDIQRHLDGFGVPPVREGGSVIERLRNSDLGSVKGMKEQIAALREADRKHHDDILKMSVDLKIRGEILTDYENTIRVLSALYSSTAARRNQPQIMAMGLDLGDLFEKDRTVGANANGDRFDGRRVLRDLLERLQR